MTDQERDDYLLTALRHAPDRDVAPPAAVSEAILKRAQAAIHKPSPVRDESVEALVANASPSTSSRRTLGWWQGWMQAINALLRPAPAAAFGTLAVAGIVGLMWATQEPPSVANEPPLVAVPSSPQRSESAAASAPTAPTAPPPPAADRAVVEQKPPAPPTAAVVKAAPPKAKSPVAQAAAPSPAPAQPSAPLAAGDASHRAAPATAAADSAAVAPAPASLPAPPAPAPAPAPEPAPAPARAVASLESAAPSAMRSDAADAVARSAVGAPLKSSAADVAVSAAMRQRSATETSALQRAGRSGASPLVSAMALLNAAGDDAQWMSPQGQQVAHSAAQQQWLADINRSTAGAWQRVPGSGASPPGSAPWTLRQRESAVGSLWLEGATLWWRDARGALFSAAASEEQVRGWIDEAKGW